VHRCPICVFDATPPPQIHPLSLHDALPILGLNAIEAARAIIDIANVQMACATRLVSLDKGHDPRDFAFFAFGGAGPVHAVEIARSEEHTSELQSREKLVCRLPLEKKNRESR